MKTYTIIAGVNGTGKSSLTGALKAERSDLGRIVDTDQLTARNGGDLLEGGKAAVAMIESCLHQGISFTQETTLSGRKTQRTARLAKELGYHIRLYYIGLDSVEECIGRIQNRVRKGGHDIPEKDVRRRFQTRFDDLQRVLPYCNEAILMDNGNGFVEIGEYRNGELQLHSGKLPAWATELAEKMK